MANLKQANNVQLSIHKANVKSHRAEIQSLRQKHTTQLKAKDVFCDAEKNRVLAEL